MCSSDFYHITQTSTTGNDFPDDAGVSHIRGNDVYYSNLTGTASSNGANQSDENTATAEQGILSLELDAGAGTLKYYWNNSLVRTDSTLTGGDQYVPFVFTANSGGNLWEFATFNFGQDSSFAGGKTAQGNNDANANGAFY